MNTFAKNLEIRSNVTSGMDRIWDVPRCYVAQSSAQSIANGVDVVSFNFVARDTDGMFNPAAPTRVTCRTQGIYDVKWNITFATSAAGTHRQGWVRVNAGTSRYGYDLRHSNADGYGRVLGSDSITLNAGDYMELITEQDGGATTLAPSAGLYNGAELNVTLLSTT